MGSRLSIEIQGLLNTPRISIEFTCEDLNADSNKYKDVGKGDIVEPPFMHQKAKVTFLTEFGPDYSRWFDVTSHDSKLSLECDWNFFRSPEHHADLMRRLFENGVSFKVITG